MASGTLDTRDLTVRPHAMATSQTGPFLPWRERSRPPEPTVLKLTVFAFKSKAVENSTQAWAACALETGTCALGNDKLDALSSLFGLLATTLKMETARGNAPRKWFQRTAATVPGRWLLSRLRGGPSETEHASVQLRDVPSHPVDLDVDLHTVEVAGGDTVALWGKTANDG